MGNIIGPQTFQARDAPQYRPAKLAVMGTQAGCALTTFVLFLYYVWANKKRRAEVVRGEEKSSVEAENMYMSPEVWTGMTDFENRRFLYVY